MTDGGQAVGGGPVLNGIDLASQRLARFGLALEGDAVQAAVELATSVLAEDARDETPGPAAVEMFVEAVAVGASVRVMNGEEELSSRDLEQALRAFKVLLNSLWHYDDCM